MRETREEVHLTPRETQVLMLVVEGLSTKQIAQELEIAPKTVDGHVERMRLRMGAHNRCHMVGLAASMGFLDVDSESSH